MLYLLDLEILKLNDIHKLQVAKLMFKYGKDNTTGNTNAINLIDYQNYNTRLASNSNYYLQQPRTNFGLRSFSYVGQENLAM